MAGRSGHAGGALGGRGRGARRRSGAAWIAVGAGLAGLATACASGNDPRTACATFYASERLNLYDGVAHPITVYVYPLSSSSAFEQTPVVELLDGEMPAGAAAPPVPITVAPGEERSFEETFPAETRQLGILADYYRAPGDPEGTRTQVVPARCGLRKPKLTLSPKDVYPR